MYSIKRKLEHKITNGEVKPINPTLAVLLVGAIFFLGGVTYSNDWSLALWLLSTIAILLILYTWRRASKRNLEASSFSIPYTDRTLFCDHFVPYMKQIGFDEEKLSESTYRFTLASRSHIRIGTLVIPPIVWGQLTMTLSDQSAIITGPHITLTTLQQMLRRRMEQSDTVSFPLEA